MQSKTYIFTDHIPISPAIKNIISGTIYFRGCCHKSSSILQLRTGQNHSNRTDKIVLCSAIISAVMIFACPGSVRTACSKPGSQESNIQIGVFRHRTANPSGITFTPSNRPNMNGIAPAITHFVLCVSFCYSHSILQKRHFFRFVHNR